MDFKKLRQIVRNPRHISGIHNYCDRWCERCPFTLRCSTFAMEQARGDGEEHSRKLEELWPRLEALGPDAAALIAKNADHPGVGVAANPKFKEIREHVDRSRIGAAAKRYMEFAHVFAEKRSKGFPRLPPGEGDAGVSLAEAFDVIAFYQFFITVKLARALREDVLAEEMARDPELANMPRDQDGSAKVALIAMDRSILAWSVFHGKEPGSAALALSAMLTLSRLRAAVEKEMPNARKFVRAGFDTVKFPKK